MENIKLACSEVYCILEILGDSYKNKLPNKLIEFINKNRNTEFFLETKEKSFEDLKISKDGIVFISLLNLKYWEKDENEKQKLMEIYKKNDEKKQEKLNSYKNPDWLRNSNKKEEVNYNQDTEDKLDKIASAENENMALIEVKKVTFFDKIKMIINKIFNKKKE